MSDDPEDGSTGEPTDELTHTDASGEVRMVDVGDKPDTSRRAVARGEIRLTPSTIEAVEADEVGKGDVLATARVGAVQAVKHTGRRSRCAIRSRSRTSTPTSPLATTGSS